MPPTLSATPGPVPPWAMTTTTRTREGGVDHLERSDARLALGAAVGALVAFVVLVMLPATVADFAPPAGADLLWRVGAPFGLVLAPLVAGLAGVRSWWVLWVRRDLDDTTRRLHLVVLVLAAAFAVLLASPTGQLAAAWWQD